MPRSRRVLQRQPAHRSRYAGAGRCDRRRGRAHHVHRADGRGAPPRGRCGAADRPARRHRRAGLHRCTCASVGHRPARAAVRSRRHGEPRRAAAAPRDTRGGDAGRLDHRSRLDRVALAAGRVSDARGARCDRRRSPGAARARRRPRGRRELARARACRHRRDDARSARRADPARCARRADRHADRRCGRAGRAPRAAAGRSGAAARARTRRRAQHAARLDFKLQIAGNSRAEVGLLCRLRREGRLSLRIYDAIGGPGADADALLAGDIAREPCDGVTVGGIKLYMDGALGSRGAALLAPYSDAPDSRGLLLGDAQQLLPLLLTALRQGVQIETHAIGDRGNRLTLDLYERAFAAVPPQERRRAAPRWRIEHAQVLDAADLPRFAQLDVIASMQPSHAISDLYFAPARLGPQRLAGAYAWRSLLDSGAVVAAGTDAPVERGDPIQEFYAATVRRSLDGFAGEGWHREQRVSRAEALAMLTRAPAYAAFQEHERGTLEVGKLADFTVLSQDLLAVPDDEILATRVRMTVIGGGIVFRDDDDAVRP
ncbi:MAG: amidohydrolase family protein [Steroidobacteraceae bacterium]|nr:amidohydrolase family protein [Steroidobacteraceae bacterium]